MKRFIALITIALAATAALAGGKPPTPAGNPHAQADAAANATGQGFGYGAPASINGDSRTLALPSWGGGYSGQYSVCNKGWGFGAAWGPDMDCVREIAKLERDLLTHRHQLGPVAKDHPTVGNPLGRPHSRRSDGAATAQRRSEVSVAGHTLDAADPTMAQAARAAPLPNAAQRIDDATRARARAAAANRGAAKPAVDLDPCQAPAAQACAKKAGKS